jgi:hypothetical protein
MDYVQNISKYRDVPLLRTVTYIYVYFHDRQRQLNNSFLFESPFIFKLYRYIQQMM